MKFEVGKEYRAGSGTITIEKRSVCYVTVSGMHTGRLMVREWLTGGEIVLVPIGHGVTVFCFSWKTRRFRVYTEEYLPDLPEIPGVSIDRFGTVAVVTVSANEPEFPEEIFKGIKVLKVEET